MGIFTLGDLVPELPEAGRYWIAPDATVIGRVRLGIDVGIWFGAVLRGDNEWLTVGEGSNLQEHVVVHSDPGSPMTVGKGCTIGHRAIIHGCTIGDNTLIGMGAIIMNDARIGPNSIVAAGALVPEGKSFPENSLILGAPARAVRPLQPDEIARNQRSAAHYRERAALFRAELKPL